MDLSPKIVNGLTISGKRSILDNGQDSECSSIRFSTQSSNIYKNKYVQFLEFSIDFLGFHQSEFDIKLRSEIKKI